MIKKHLRQRYGTRAVNSYSLLLNVALHYRTRLIAMLFLSLLVSFFEVSSIGLFALAVSIVVSGKLPEFFSGTEFLKELSQPIFDTVEVSVLFVSLILIGVAVQILKSILLYLGKRISIGVVFWVSKELQELVTKRMFSLKFSELEAKPPGAISETIKQAEKVAVLVQHGNQGVLAILLIFFYGMLMFVTSPELSMFSAGLILIVGVVMGRIIRRLKYLGGEIVKGSLKTGKQTIEFLGAPRLLKVFDLSEFATTQVNRARNLALVASRDTSVIRASIDPVIEIGTVGMAGAFLIGGYLLAGPEGKDTLTVIFVFLVALQRVIPQVRAINHIRMTGAVLLPMLENVGDAVLLNEEQVTRKGGRHFSGLTKSIDFTDVDFRYPTATEDALKNISFTLPRGSTLAIVGASGAGKTTIADLVLGLQEPTRGRISVDGTPLSEIDMSLWLAGIGYVDQEVVLFDGTISENIALGQKSFDSDEIQYAAEKANAKDFILSLQDQFEANVGERGHILSVGQKQRIALARAIIRNPDLLILDEATSALDVRSENVIRDTLSVLQGSYTVLIIAHRLSTVIGADRVIVLDEGHIVETGQPSNLIKAGGAFAKLWSETELRELD